MGFLISMKDIHNNAKETEKDGLFVSLRIKNKFLVKREPLKYHSRQLFSGLKY